MLYAVRHSERIDLESPELFVEHKKRFEAADTTLTPRGHVIASETGTLLKDQISSQYPDKKIIMISSPYIRCIQTAVKIMKEIPNEMLHSNTLQVEDGFQELYNSLTAGLAEDTPQKLVYKKILEGDTELKKEFLGEFGHENNTLLDYTLPHPYAPKWEERFQTAVLRFAQRLEELTGLYSKPEYQNVIFVVVCHGLLAPLAKSKTGEEMSGDYCSTYNFNIVKNKCSEDPREDKYEWDLINGEQYGYDRKPVKPLEFFYVRHSIRCDKNDRENHKKHVDRGLETKDTPQTEYGKEIAVETGKYLREEFLTGKFKGKKNIMVISSPYHRCIQTSTSLIEGFGKELLYNNNLYIEEGFEEFYSSIAHLVKRVRWTRSFNRFEYDEELKRELLGDLSYTKNALLNYEYENTPMNIKWEESVKQMVARFFFRFQDLKRKVNRTPELEDLMIVVVAHGCIRDVGEFHLKKELEVTKYCAVNLMKLENHSLEMPIYNKTCYDESKIIEDDLDVAMPDSKPDQKAAESKIEESNVKTIPLKRAKTQVQKGVTIPLKRAQTSIRKGVTKKDESSTEKSNVENKKDESSKEKWLNCKTMSYQGLAALASAVMLGVYKKNN